jgi:O-antigen ligase
MFESEYILLLLPLGVIAVMAGAYAIMAVAAGRAWAAMTLIFVTIFLLDTIFRARAYSDKSIDFQIILKAGSWAALLLFSLLHFHRYAGALFRVPHIVWLLFFCWLLATTLNAPNPTYTAMAVFSVVALYLACLALHTDYDREMVLAVILGSCLLVVVLSLFAYVAIPSFGRLEEWQGGAQIQGHRLSGITGTPNGIGIISAWCVLVIAIHWHALRHYLHSSVLFFGGMIALVTLALSQSRTAMAILLVLTGITFTLRRRYTPYLLISGAIIVTIVAIFAISDSDLFLRLLSRSGNVMEIETGTGRAQIWSLVIKLAQSNFWTGQGYASTVFILPDYSDYMSHAPPHAHNMWLQLWLTTGMIGVILFSLAFVSQTIRAILDKDGLSITFLAFVMLDGITEPSAFAGVAHLSTVVLLIAAARSIHGSSALPSWTSTAASSQQWPIVASARKT